MRVLITGIAGFIGSNLVRTLQSKVDLVGIDDFSTGYRENLRGTDLEFIEGSVLDESVLKTAIRGCDVVVHLAAIPSVPRSLQHPTLTHEANATGTLRVLEAARSVPESLVIVASSSSVYGASPKIPKQETDLPCPMSPYAVSKLAAEQYSLAWQYSYRIRTLPFRFFNVYGPGQSASHSYAAVIPSFLSSVLKGEPLTIYGDGNQTRDFTYVKTVCEVLENAILNKVSNSTPVNLAFGTRTTINDLVSEIERLCGSNVEVLREQDRPGDVRHSQADNRLLRNLFPQTTPTTLSDGLRETYEWMKSNLKDQSS